MSSKHGKKTAQGKTAKNGTTPPLKFQSPPCAPTRAGRQAVTLKTDRPPAGWSSPVARQAHNLKVAGSNPAPATTDDQTRWSANPVSDDEAGLDRKSTRLNSSH